MKGSCFQSTLLPPCLFSQESPSAPSVPSEALWSGERLGNHRALGNQGGSCGPQVILCRKSALHLVNWELRVVWGRENICSKSFYCPFLTGFHPNGQPQTYPAGHIICSALSRTLSTASGRLEWEHMVCRPLKVLKMCAFATELSRRVYLNYFDISSIYQSYYLGKLVILQGRANHAAEEPEVELAAHNRPPCSDCSAALFGHR